MCGISLNNFNITTKYRENLSQSNIKKKKFTINLLNEPNTFVAIFTFSIILVIEDLIFSVVTFPV